VYSEECLSRPNASEWHKRFEESSESENAKIMGKTMLTAFFDAKSTINHEFVPGKQTLNSKFYKKVIKRLIARIHCIRLEFQESGAWYLLHNNAPVHSLGVVSEFLAK
jgi:hypothetical protein